jgi:hypothetical protein
MRQLYQLQQNRACLVAAATAAAALEALVPLSPAFAFRALPPAYTHKHKQKPNYTNVEYLGSDFSFTSFQQLLPKQ